MFEDFNPHVWIASAIILAVIIHRTWIFIPEEIRRKTEPSRLHWRHWATALLTVILGGLLTIILDVF